jgi:hypothetical protein
MTRQNAGKLLNNAGFGPNGPGVAGGVKAPAATLCAELIVTLGRLSLERLSQVDPPVGEAANDAASSKAREERTNKRILFNMDILL